MAKAKVSAKKAISTISIRDRIKRFDRVPASQVAPSPHNWRTHPAQQQAALRGVLEEIGFAGAVLCREDDDGKLHCIDGHLRLETMGAGEVPVLVTDLSEGEAKTILATFDPLGAMAETNAAALDALLREVQTESEAVAKMLEGVAAGAGCEWAKPEAGAGGDEFDTTPEHTGPTRTNVGELWEIEGGHRLLVGDNTIAENVERLMGGERVGLCFTSPPYGQQRDYGEAAKEKCSDWLALMQGTFANLPMTDAGQVLVNLGLIHREGEWIPYWDPWIEWMRAQGWRRFGWYVWDQGSGLPGDWCGRFAPSHEWIFHFNKESQRPEKNVAKKPDSIKAKKVTDGGLRGKDGVVSRLSSPLACMQAEKIGDSVVRVNRSHEAIRSDHPAVFPVELSTFIQECWPADVYDPFLGSGTTLIAAQRLGRRCYGMEIEPRYADVILKRCEAEGLTVTLVDKPKKAKK